MISQEQIVRFINVRITEERLKQKDIAKEIGITEDRLSRILSLKSKMLAEEMILLCAVLKINPNEFRKPA